MPAFADSSLSPNLFVSRRAEHSSAAQVGNVGELSLRTAASFAHGQGTPVTFDRCGGFLYPGSRSAAVLMLGPIGYEEMCSRTTWRTLAESFSAAGFACLRFDYPGISDALPPLREPADLSDWYEAIRSAARCLREESGCEHLIIVGQGIGGTFSVLLARELGPLQATILMAPVSNGARYLRELNAWAHILSERIGIERDPDDKTGCAVAGFSITQGRVAAIKKLNLSQMTEAPCADMLLVARPQHVGDETLACQMTDMGVHVTCIEYHGFGNLMTDPTQVEVPRTTIAAIINWAESLPGSNSRQSKSRRVSHDNPASLAPVLFGAGFSERPFRFGPSNRMFGILCQPSELRAESAAIFVNAGRDYHIGWAGMIVEQARALAAQGVASLRFDGSGIGDSLATPEESSELLYSVRQVEDVCTAIDQLEAAGFSRVTLIGRCSGAYAAFHAAAADPRVERLVMINAERYVWDPDERVEDALRYGHRSIGDFGATLWRRGGFRRLFAGQLKVVPATRYIAFRLWKRATRQLAPVLGSLTKQGKLHREVHRLMRTLMDRDTRTAFVFSEDDFGLAEFHTYFGQGGQKLAAYPRISVAMVADADHNFTNYGARQRLLAVLRQVVST